MMCEQYVHGTEPKHIQRTFSHLHAVISADSVFIFCSWRMVYEKHSVAALGFNNSFSLISTSSKWLKKKVNK